MLSQSWPSFPAPISGLKINKTIPFWSVQVCRHPCVQAARSVRTGLATFARHPLRSSPAGGIRLLTVCKVKVSLDIGESAHHHRRVNAGQSDMLLAALLPSLENHASSDTDVRLALVRNIDGWQSSDGRAPELLATSTVRWHLRRAFWVGRGEGWVKAC